MSEQTEQPEERTTDAFRRLSSESTWRSNGNGVAHAPNNASANRSEITPDCERCNDSLWVLAGGENGGKLTVVPCSCQSVRETSISQLKTYSQLGHLERMTFEAVIPEGRKGRVDENLFKAATETAKEFAGDPSGWLVLEGSAGSGKTHLAASIVNALIDRGSPAKYVSALDIPDLVRNERFEDTDGAEGGTFGSLLAAPVLVVDDLGAQQANNWIDSKVDQLLTHRFNGRLPTVVVLAKPISEMPDRIALKLDDPDYTCVLRITESRQNTGLQRVDIPKPHLDRMTFESFDPDGSATVTDEQFSLNMALYDARNFADESLDHNWLLLHGPTGVGKTHLAVAIANVRIRQGLSVTFWSVSDLLDKLREAYSNPDESYFYRLFDSVRNSEMLILDDFGQQNMTDWTLEKLYQLISYRHDRLLPTVITSQYIVWDDAKNDGWIKVRSRRQWESICSRLKDQNVVTERLMAAPDYRMRG